VRGKQLQISDTDFMNPPNFIFAFAFFHNRAFLSFEFFDNCSTKKKIFEERGQLPTLPFFPLRRSHWLWIEPCVGF